jgi:hypothetical protein
MSGKRMKKLRRQAEAQTVGVPWKLGQVRYNTKLSNYSEAPRVELRPESGRHIYQQLKKE